LYSSVNLASSWFPPVPGTITTGESTGFLGLITADGVVVIARAPPKEEGEEDDDDTHLVEEEEEEMGPEQEMEPMEPRRRDISVMFLKKEENSGIL
jgi:uncharacterized ferredoxin-like protein